MTQRTTVSCPLGDKCPSGGNHYPDSSIYQEHQRMANGGGGAGGPETAEETRQRVYQPMGDQTEDPEESYYRRVDLRDRQVGEWVDYLRERSESGEAIKGSTIVGYSSDQENESFTVTYKTGEQIVFIKDADHEDSFMAVKYKGKISDDNIVSQDLVPADEVEKVIDDEDKGNRLQYMGLAAAGVAATAHQWGKENSDDDLRELEPKNSVLYRWLNKFLGDAFFMFR